MGFFDLFDGVSTSTTCTSNCASCGAYMHCRSAKLEGKVGTNDVLLILPQPTETEDVMGCGYGEEYVWLSRQLSDVGICYNDCSRINLTGCYSARKRSKMITDCYSRVKDFIDKVKPRLVLVFGDDALPITVGKEFSRDIGTVNTWKRYTIPYYTWGCWLQHVHSPEEMLNHDKYEKNAKWKKATSFSEKVEAVSTNGTYLSLLREFKKSVADAYIKSREELPPHIDSYTTVKVLTPKESIDYLASATEYLCINTKAICEYDLETTGIKLFDKGHSVFSMSICYQDTESASFRVTEENLPAITAFLKNEFNWCGHNFKYDAVASAVHLGHYPTNLRFDTQLASHLYNNTPGTKSLKFNTFAFLGVGDYESATHEFLEATAEEDELHGSNAINRIYDAPEHLVLLYGGKDTLYTRHVRKALIREINRQKQPNFKFLFNLFCKGSIALGKIELRGMRVDTSLIEEHKAQCEKEMEEVLAQVEKTDTWKVWKEKYGEEATIGSDVQTIDILYKTLGLFPDGITRTTKYKADSDWLSRTKDPICPLILRYRALHKNGVTYLTSFLREKNDDRLRCLYSLSNVRSFRGSSSTPNLQNISAHSPESCELLRTCFIPDEGYQIAESDYSSLELYVSYMYSNCPKLKQYLTEGDADMHADTCKRAMMFSDSAWEHLGKVNKKMQKEARSTSKKINFGLSYGSYYRLIAPTIWTDINDKKLMHDENMSVRDWLIQELDMDSKWEDYKKKPIKAGEQELSQEEFYCECYTAHMRTVEEDYWHRFKEVQDWRRDNYNFFLQNGYFTNKTGGTYQGYHSLNQTGNFPIQSTGFHILLWSICRIMEICEERGYKSYIANTIHDSIISYVKVEERDEYLKMVEDVMTNQVEEAFPFINIHLGVEHEVAEEGKPWASKALYEYHEVNEED